MARDGLLHCLCRGRSAPGFAFHLSHRVTLTRPGILLQRFPTTKVLGVNVFFWGVTLCCSAAVKNYAGLCALRVLLGMMEAVIGTHPI